ncbi:MAG: thiol-disulfide oxidoreductase DCC family protein [Bacteroidetes bacterium]|nr:thiol-disulfide oxidoreductase DCC family protein [Bacteroidota bacterium]
MNSPVLLFDGVCNYCNAWVNFVIRHDKKKKFRFAALQSEAGKKIMQQHNIPAETDSAALIDNGKVYTKSSLLRVMKHVGGIYFSVYLLIIVPKFIRDFAYDIIARNRYKWWGKKNECMIPMKEVRERFL